MTASWRTRVRRVLEDSQHNGGTCEAHVMVDEALWDHIGKQQWERQGRDIVLTRNYRVRQV